MKWTQRMSAGAGVLALLGVTAGPVGAQGIVDQENLPATGYIAAGCGTSGGSLSQGFTPTLPMLVGVEIYTLGANGVVATVRVRDGAVDGPVLGEASATTQDGWVRFDFPDEVAVVPGQLYVIEWPNAGYWAENTSDTYPGGTAYGCTNNLIPTYDAAFRTYATAALPVEHVNWGVVKSRYRD